jgi:8-amino-7-oxononanoate synthase
MLPDDLDRALNETLSRRRAEYQLRERIVAHPIDSTHIDVGGKRYVNFASNNYLGVTHHPRVLRAIEESLKHGAGSAAAGLISGYTDVHRSAEQAIARWKGTEACILLPSGYQANIAAVQTLASLGNVRFLLDKLVHASLIDAVRSTDAEVRVFPHNNHDKLQRLLREAAASEMQVVITESIFSMDGDAADLGSLARIKKELPFILLLDEAHGSGIYGPSGAGYAAELDLQSIVDISVVTLSKALGCAGGAVCASRAFCDTLLNLGRAYIYSTSVPPMIAAAAQAAVEVCCGEPHRQARVRELARRVRGELIGAGMSIPSGDSPITPIILGEEARALDAASALRERDLWVIAVRPPTVPHGSSRLRVTLSCDHTDEEVTKLIDALKQLQ